MNAQQSDARHPSLRRTAIAVFSAPLLLAACVAPLAAFVAATRSLEGDDLMRAIEPMTPVPIAIGFALMLMLTARLARGDGLDLAAIGWKRPSPKDLLIGGAATPIVVLTATLLAYPAIQRVRPMFDPAVPQIAFAPAALMLIVAVVAEDTLYRGYALRQLSSRIGRPGAVVLTSIAYALLAPGQGWPLVLFAFILGIGLCAIRLATVSIVPVMFVHAATALAPKVEALLAKAS